MGLSDTQLDELQAALAAGGELDRASARALIAEAQESRRILGLAARAVGLVSGAAVDLAERRYRKLTPIPIGDDGWVNVTTDFPVGFSPPVNGRNS